MHMHTHMHEGHIMCMLRLSSTVYTENTSKDWDEVFLSGITVLPGGQPEDKATCRTAQKPTDCE